MTVPVAGYALLSDRQGAALVSPDGSVDWWCAPRFDSRATFARMLDPGGGHFALRVRGATARRRYLEGTFVLETTWTLPDGGVVRVTDALALGPAAAQDVHGHGIGREAPHALVRRVECIAAGARVDLEWSPRLEFGLVSPHLERTTTGVRSMGGPDAVFLEVEGDVDLRVEASDVRAAFELREGETVGFAALVREGFDAPAPDRVGPVGTATETADRWRTWAAHHLPYTGYAARLVERSLLVLQALSYEPTGATVAAPTTSLPEVPGGDANWDYRFCWLRDASLVVKAWLGTACPHEGARFFAFVAAAAGPVCSSARMQIVYGVGGEHDLGERELGWLEGYDGARPVRIGNGAWDQQQLDVPGYVLDSACTLAEQDDADPFPETVTAFLRTLADHAAEHWTEPDSGIWEGREGEREYLPSKVLCWVALDRAVRLHEAGRLGEAADAERWGRERDAVRADVLERGFRPGLGAYTGAYGSDHHDAAVLLMPLLGFLPADDERMAATVDAVERDLMRDGLLMRWTGAADEGRFLACTFWLAHALALRGELDRARAAFERAASCASDLGLLSEMAVSAGGALLGNHPQALTHVALVNAATCIDAMTRAGTEPA